MSNPTFYPSGMPMPFSRAVRAGDFLLLSGQIPLDDRQQPLRGDIAAQTRNVMDRIGATLAHAGASWRDVVKVNVWLADLNDFAAFNAVYASYFETNFPVRSLVQAQLAFGVGVEIEAQAWQGG